MVTVTNAAGLRAALDRLVVERVDRPVAAVAREVAVYCFTQWTNGVFKWSVWNTDHFAWSGQARASVNVGIGAPDPSFTPYHPATEAGGGEIAWPEPVPGQYEPRDPFDARFVLDGLLPYQTVYVSNNAPHILNVEQHTQVAHMSAEFTRSHFQPGYSWSPIVTASASVPF